MRGRAGSGGKDVAERGVAETDVAETVMDVPETEAAKHPFLEKNLLSRQL